MALRATADSVAHHEEVGAFSSSRVSELSAEEVAEQRALDALEQSLKHWREYSPRVLCWDMSWDNNPGGWSSVRLWRAQWLACEDD